MKPSLFPVVMKGGGGRADIVQRTRDHEKIVTTGLNGWADAVYALFAAHSILRREQSAFHAD